MENIELRKSLSSWGFTRITKSKFWTAVCSVSGLMKKFMLASEAMPWGNSLYVKISSDTRLILGNRIHAIHTCWKKASSLTLSNSNDDCNKHRSSGISKGLGQKQTVISTYNLDPHLTSWLFFCIKTREHFVKPKDSLYLDSSTHTFTQCYFRRNSTPETFN